MTSIITVTTTYLALSTRAQFRPALSDDPALEVCQSRAPLAAFYRFLYSAVGTDYTWTDRLAWSDAEIEAYLAQPSTTLLVGYWRGTPAGYIELQTAPHESGTEIVYFGLIPAFHGRGFGKHLLSVGVQRAYDDGAARVWLHTCTLDGPYALANYTARGFVPYRTTTHEQIIT